MDRPPSVRRPRAWAWYIILAVVALLILLEFLKHLYRAHINEGSMRTKSPPAVLILRLPIPLASAEYAGWRAAIQLGGSSAGDPPTKRHEPPRRAGG